MPRLDRVGAALWAVGSSAVETYRTRSVGAEVSRDGIAVGTSADGRSGRKLPGEQTELHEVLSSLIQGVYATDRGLKDAHLFYEALGYEQETLEDEHPDDDIAKVGNPSCKIRLMVFRRRDLAQLQDQAGAAHNDTVESKVSLKMARESEAQACHSNSTPKAEFLPKYVVAIRGTRKYCQRDIKADLQIMLETLHHNTLYDIVKSMTRRVVEKHPHDSVWVAGHSLGAAIGLIVTRELALENMPVETHLFNPPFLSLETLLEKATLLASKGLNKLNRAFKAGTEGMPANLQSAHDYARSSRIMKLAREKKAKLDAKYLETMTPDFIKLEKWSPHLYVNPYDPICNGYIHYFRKQNLFYGGLETQAISLTSGTLRRFFTLDSHSYHLIPSAILHINHRGDTNVLESHPLHQWHEYPTINLQHEKHDLLDELASEDHDHGNIASHIDELRVTTTVSSTVQTPILVPD
ncbi:uncharacterized protein [Physcomitrium patens]|uniref:Fungal lipase-type domain-containing protein n=1 Tax=Physcomitrium patens TaxID=3218 RepID=A0A2K1IBN5_PHYPA|nr:uncharacterized protein LOC112277760 [Physcomitrium patens]PNR26700.1 hypothetical protein PHYPA_030181 [Physcomitrium patens]|eukprot:XP_024366224.1 uncharacterized protein LOC112277760 [Physcomitrella patens]